MTLILNYSRNIFVQLILPDMGYKILFVFHSKKLCT